MNNTTPGAAVGNCSTAAPAASLIDEPVFILTCARSGSTLLRKILDAHHDLACPQETNVVFLFAQLWDTWMVLDPDCGSSALTEEARLHIRSTVNSMYQSYLTRQGKVRWCDKSLGSVKAADKIAQIYENAKFICLYRHAMDMINSGLEATPFGLGGYGFEPYAGPNSAASLASYWTDHTKHILEFEESHPNLCFRVYYEQLVTEPEQVTDNIFRFLRVPTPPSITQHAITDRDEAGKFEFGDHKIRAAREITDASVGRGVRIPPALFPGEQRSAMNQVLTQLGYTAVDRDWEMATVPPVLLAPKPGHLDGSDTPAEDDADQNGPHASGGEPDPPGREPDEEAALLRFCAIDEEFKSRITQNLEILPDGLAKWKTMAIVAYSLRPPKMAAAWRVDRECGEINSDLDEIDFQSLDTELAFTGEIDTWRSVLDGTENLASALRQHRIRHIGQDAAADSGSPIDMMQVESQLLPVLAHILGLGASPR